MGVDTGDESRPVSRIERVRCLGCGVVYVKPTGGGTVSANPGCPDCGYVGWVGVTVDFGEETSQRRFYAGRLRRRSARAS